jgi:hypothetical protein
MISKIVHQPKYKRTNLETIEQGNPNWNIENMKPHKMCKWKTMKT